MLDNSLVESAEEVSRIAFGFMASKALFAGLHIDVFTHLSDGPKSSEEISKKSKVPINRVTTLMTALTSIGLVDRQEQGEIYSNSPGAEAFLSKN
ncbi:MAG: methyltransferase, partial [Betaproteobacteria bacterium]|nr:methyltransferase [Betaproteobacteria bacterium]